MSEQEIPSYMPDWIRDHVRRYRESDGADGHMWDATLGGGQGLVPTLLLTTTGRRSGNTLTLPLIYGETEGGYLVIASKGGFPTHPAWYHNLVANPGVELQVVADRFKARAGTAEGAERTRLWDQMVALYAPYSEYQARTEREIPVVVLER
ncbi:MAG: nitroreductase family deazaflavin-dependent oxidoreductase [Myxococcales bacterium]|nr:nitroreductase family deazaflavin-dependent oxidoreductase [Myxococcales bacterium]